MAKVADTTLTLNWTAATDNTSSQADLQYLAYYSTSNNIATVASCEANGTAIGAYAANINTVNVTGLTATTNYYFNVIVKDTSGNKTLYTTIIHIYGYLVAQSSFSVTVGDTREYKIDSKPTIIIYDWEAYSDVYLTTLTASNDVTLTSLGAGRENEIEVTWNSAGTYYLVISVTDNADFYNFVAYTFNVGIN